MGKIARSWRLTKACFHILSRERYLIWFPFLAGLSSLLVVGPLIAGVVVYFVFTRDALNHDDTVGRVTGFASVFLTYFVSYFLATFFNVGLIACVLNRLEGKPASFGLGFRAALDRLGAIAGWALLAATVGMILRLIEQRSEWLGKLVARLLGLAWSLVTFLIAPIIAYEGLGPLAAAKRGANLFRATWGEQLSFRVGTGIFFSIVWFVFFFGMTATAIAVPALTGFASKGSLLLIWILGMVVTAVLGSAVISLVSSCLTSIYNAVLYSYAVKGTLPEQFDEALVPPRSSSS